MAVDPASHYSSRLVLLSSPAGQRLAASLTVTGGSRLRTLLSLFEAQEEQSWCGYAALRVALRACGAAAVLSQSELHGLRSTLAEQEAENVRGGASSLAGGGLSIAQLARLARPLLEASALNLEQQHGDPASPPAFGSQLAAAVSHASDSDSGSIVLLNFLRQLDGWRGGHWVVAGGLAHDAEGTAFVLLLDVAAHRIGPHWLPLGLLAALCSTVNVHGVPRGFVRICSRGSGASGDGAVPLVPKQDSASHC